jgi:hypothetical protein
MNNLKYNFQILHFHVKMEIKKRNAKWPQNYSYNLRKMNEYIIFVSYMKLCTFLVANKQTTTISIHNINLYFKLCVPDLEIINMQFCKVKTKINSELSLF